MTIHSLGNLLPTMFSKNCNIRARLDILKNLESIVRHENFVPKHCDEIQNIQKKFANIGNIGPRKASVN